jgi:hypothetical protein
LQRAVAYSVEQRTVSTILASVDVELSPRHVRRSWCYGAQFWSEFTLLLSINNVEVEVSLKCARRSDCYDAQY